MELAFFPMYYNRKFEDVLFTVFYFDLKDGKYQLNVSADKDFPVTVKFLKSLQVALGVSAFIKLPPTTSPIILKPQLAPEEDSVDYITESDYLPLILYSDIKDLLEDLNLIIGQLNMNVKIKRGDMFSEITEGTFFQIMEDYKIKLTIGEAEINLGTSLTNMLYLTAKDEWLTKSQISAKAIFIEQYKPPYFFLYVDFIHATGTNNFLRVINNDAKEGEYVQIASNNLHYYTISKQFISNIHINLTEPEGDDLNLEHQLF